MVIRSVDLPYVCGVKSTLPKTGKPEFVLAGRSNLVDLPGYGYAATGPVEQEKWDRMIRRYLEQGEDIEEVVLLLDCRRIPSEKDLQMFQWICSATGYEPIVIITKMDKLKRSQQQQAVKDIRKALSASPECVMIPFSATSKAGREECLDLIEKILLTKED